MPFSEHFHFLQFHQKSFLQNCVRNFFEMRWITSQFFKNISETFSARTTFQKQKQTFTSWERRERALQVSVMKYLGCKFFTKMLDTFWKAENGSESLSKVCKTFFVISAPNFSHNEEFWKIKFAQIARWNSSEHANVIMNNLTQRRKIEYRGRVENFADVKKSIRSTLLLCFWQVLAVQIWK